jgi:hypothetical protein
MGDSRAIAAAERDPLSSLHQDKGLAFLGTGADLFHMLEVHNSGTVDTQEMTRIEPGFKVRHGLAQEVVVSPGTDANIVFFGANPVDIGDRQEQDPASRLKDKTSLKITFGRRSPGRRRGCLGGSQLLPCAMQSFGEPLASERFKEVVNRVDLKRAQGIPVVGGRKDDARHRDVALSRKRQLKGASQTSSCPQAEGVNGSLASAW